MRTLLDIAKIAFETNDDQEADHAIWTYTGYPVFWHLHGNGTPIRCFWQQLRHARRSLNRGYSQDQIFEGNDRERP